MLATRRPESISSLMTTARAVVFMRCSFSFSSLYVPVLCTFFRNCLSHALYRPSMTAMSLRSPLGVSASTGAYLRITLRATRMDLRLLR